MGTLTAEVAALTLLGQVLEDGTVSGWLDVLGMSDEEAAVEHQRVLGFEVFAHESVFLSSHGLRSGGRLPWHEHGLEDRGDGLGASVLLYAWLLDRGGGEAFRRRHLGRWIAPVTVALQRQDSPLFSEVAACLAELVPSSAPALPPLRPLLEDPKTGLRQIARRLLVPALSGWYLSKHQIAGFGRAVSLPTGFGSREKMLESLLFAAVDHGELPALLGALQEEAGEWQHAYALLPRDPESSGATGWRARLGETREMLDRLARAPQAS